MAELKTKQTDANVEAFLNNIEDLQKRQDAFTILAMMEATTKATAKMWGPAIIGFGDKRLVYNNGRELDWFIMGFSPRKQNFALYVSAAVKDEQGLLSKLGKYKTGKGCLYINKIEDIHMPVLTQILQQGLEK
ncbi:DUF1801 domain-containing protein [Parasediminibacterium paludis]|uniref:DUF1801 domain-containing protein n=1 Tax=Parasediminibacterium paludis TaxID=908966 RepID=A0ABV8PU13_9BACT